MSFFYIRQILTGDLGGVFLHEQKTGKGFLPHKRTDFVTFALRRSDCSLAGSFLSETVLSGRTERLTQGNKTVLYAVKSLSCFRLLSNTLPFILSEEPTLFLEDSIFGRLCDFLSCFGCFVWLHRVFCSVLLPAVPVLPLARPLRGAFYLQRWFPIASPRFSACSRACLRFVHDFFKLLHFFFVLSEG